MKKDYPYKKLEARCNNVDVEILGVKHTEKFFKDYNNFFEDFISKQDAIILEQPKSEFWKSEFFGSLADFTHKQKKKVYQSDPINSLLYNIDVCLALVGSTIIINSSKKIVKNQDRRTFIKDMSVIGLGISFLSGSTPGYALRMLLSGEKDTDYGIDDIIGYGGCDYRNITIAKGIRKICNQSKDIKKIGAIHGSVHSNAIYTYLTNPKLSKKILVYLPYKLITETKVREYTPTDNGWKLTNKF